MCIAYRLLAAVLAAVAAIPVLAQQTPYRLEEGWGKLPDGRKWGNTSGVDLDRNGNIWVFERCGSTNCVGSTVPPIVKLDPAGKQLLTFGAGMFVMPHGLYVDNDNNVWVTDADGKDRKGHQVFKFSAEGRLLLTLGKAGVAADPIPSIDLGCRHCADATSSSPTVRRRFNARIVKAKARVHQAWGRKVRHGEFDTLHALIDSKDACWSAIAATAACRSLTRTAGSSRNCASSAGPAASSSIATTCCT
jgi:hypothetical protein